MDTATNEQTATKNETAESFARDYLDDLFNNNKNLGAFEEETLDLDIKSKYDELVVEEIEPKQEAAGSGPIEPSDVAKFEVEKPKASEPEEGPIEPSEVSKFEAEKPKASEPEEGAVEPSKVSKFEVEKSKVSEQGEGPIEPSEDAKFEKQKEPEIVVTVAEIESAKSEETKVLEPGHETFEEKNGDNSVTGNEMTSDKDHDHHKTNGIEEIPEPGQNEFVMVEQSLITEETPQPINGHSENEIVEPVVTAKSADTFAPIPKSREFAASGATTDSKHHENEEKEDEIGELKKIGLNKNWWSTEEENKQPVDKFRTIKQNIRRGNTRSLLARFENLSKVSE